MTSKYWKHRDWPDCFARIEGEEVERNGIKYYLFSIFDSSNPERGWCGGAAMAMDFMDQVWEPYDGNPEEPMLEDHKDLTEAAKAKGKITELEQLRATLDRVREVAKNYPGLRALHEALEEKQ